LVKALREGFMSSCADLSINVIKSSILTVLTDLIKPLVMVPLNTVPHSPMATVGSKVRVHWLACSRAGWWYGGVVVYLGGVVVWSGTSNRVIPNVLPWCTGRCASRALRGVLRTPLVQISSRALQKPYLRNVTNSLKNV